MSVRAKFVVKSIERSKHWDKNKGEIHTIKLDPVVGGSKENEAFYAASPSGSINLGVVNMEAGSYFELGQEYFVDFHKVPPAP